MSVVNRKESEPKSEPQFVILAPAPALAPGGNLISGPRLSAPAPQHCLEYSLKEKNYTISIENLSQSPLPIVFFEKNEY